MLDRDIGLSADTRQAPAAKNLTDSAQSRGDTAIGRA